MFRTPARRAPRWSAFGISIRQFYVPGATTASTNLRRPNQLYAAIPLSEPVGESNYNALQTTAQKRLSKGFSVLANFTWSKSIDDVQSSANKGNGVDVTNPFNHRLDRGPSDYNTPFVFNFSGLWALPGSYSNRMARFMLGGWNLSSIVNIQSGFPFTITSGVDNARSGGSGQHADLSGESESGQSVRGRHAESVSEQGRLYGRTPSEPSALSAAIHSTVRVVRLGIRGSIRTSRSMSG